MNDPVIRPLGRNERVWLFAVLAVLLAIRLWIIPGDTDVTPAFHHDSAYIVQLAKNLNAGKGFVNNALFMTFLDTGSLPMPYHNANPLYPLLIAGAARVFGVSAAWAGVAVSAAAHTLLAGVIYLVLRRLAQPIPFAAFSAVFAALAASCWKESLAVLPDTTALFFSVTAIYLVLSAIQTGRIVTIVAAGIVFGLAWLTRSTSMLIVPGCLWFMLYRRPASRYLREIAMFLGAALIVSFPWLWWTYRTFGSPFRSDAGWSWLQDYHSRAHASVTFFMWYSPDTPPSFRDILLHQPFELFRFAASHAPMYVYNVFGGWFPARRIFAALFVACVCFAIALTTRRLWRTPAWQAAALFSVTPLAALVLRPVSVEVRYLNLTMCVLCVAVAIVFARLIRESHRLMTAAVVVPLAALSGLWIESDVRETIRYVNPSAYLVGHRDEIESIRRNFTHDELVTSDLPYYWAYYTGQHAISPLAGPTPAFVQYLRCHRSRWVFLQNENIEKLRSFSPEQWDRAFQPASTWSDATLFKVDEAGGTGSPCPAPRLN